MSWDGNLRASRYDTLKWVSDRDVLDAIISFCEPSTTERACDVGTGTGVVALELSKYFKYVVGIDSSDEMLKIAKKLRSRNNIAYVNTDANNVCGRYNCIVARMVLHHLINPSACVAALFRSLAPGGRLICVEGVPPVGCKSWYSDMFRLKENRETFSVDRLVDMLVMVGFKEIDISVVRTAQVSTREWLNASGLDEVVQQEILAMHIDAPKHVKAAYNMTLRDGDVLADWTTAIVRGTRRIVTGDK